jgi:hypothetical protein
MNNFKVQNQLINWNRVHNDVTKNYNSLKKNNYNVSVINSSDYSHSDWVNIGDSYWLYGQLYKCLENFNEDYDYLNIILGDVGHDNYGNTIDRLTSVLNKYENIGVYAPEYSNKEKCYWIVDNTSINYFEDDLCTATMADFFYICIHKDIVLILKDFFKKFVEKYPDFEFWQGNGGGLDLIICSISHILNKNIIRDTSIVLDHDCEYGAKDMDDSSHSHYTKLIDEFNDFIKEKTYKFNEKIDIIHHRKDSKIIPNQEKLWNNDRKFYLCNYANLNYIKEQQRINSINTETKVFEDVFSYNREWLESTDFYKENENILSQSRGDGYWLWKPYIILDAINKIEFGDVLFYMDSGDIFSKNLGKLIEKELKEKEIIIRHTGHIQEEYTKADCFVYMDCIDSKYYSAVQIEAGVIGIKKTQKTIDLINEWLEYAKDERILTDIPNQSEKTNSEIFIDHRHDQSILTNLLVKYNYPISKDLEKFVCSNVIEKKLNYYRSILDVDE